MDFGDLLIGQGTVAVAVHVLRHKGAEGGIREGRLVDGDALRRREQRQQLILCRILVRFGPVFSLPGRSIAFVRSESLVPGRLAVSVRSGIAVIDGFVVTAHFRHGAFISVRSGIIAIRRRFIRVRSGPVSRLRPGISALGGADVLRERVTAFDRQCAVVRVLGIVVREDILILRQHALTGPKLQGKLIYRRIRHGRLDQLVTFTYLPGPGHGLGESIRRRSVRRDRLRQRARQARRQQHRAHQQREAPFEHLFHIISPLPETSNDNVLQYQHFQLYLYIVSILFQGS